MHELHGSPSQRLMIAEINAAYPVDFVIMDVAKDRVALDAVGVGIGSATGVKLVPLDDLGRAFHLSIQLAFGSSVC